MKSKDGCKYNNSVFINVPFDAKYEKLFNALNFTIIDCGFVPRCTKEFNDGSKIRISIIYELIKECKYGIHDISRTNLDRCNNLPRFNMPLELGIFFGAKQYGNKVQNSKIVLILDKDKYRYQKYCSDIAGQDIKDHNNKCEKLIKHVRTWLANQPNSDSIEYPFSKEIYAHFKEFNELMLSYPKEYNYNEYVQLITFFLKEKHPGP